MESQGQTLTQTININVGDAIGGLAGDLANTGTSTIAIVSIGLGLIVASLLIWHFGFRRTNRKLTFRGVGLSIFALLAVTGLTLNLSSVSAATSLSLAANQETVNITVPKSGGLSNATTAITTGTANASGYKLTVALAQPEPGISLSLSGGDVASKTPLKENEAPLTLKATSAASTNDNTDLTLSFTIDASVTPGTKRLKLAYKVTDNASGSPVTMQDMTTAYCQDSMTIYDGSNEEAVVTLNDPRGDGQTYRVAKLADGKCWMLDNLKLGSTSGAIALTPADSNIGSNFSLPQLATTGTADLDNPGVYGPVPGGTGAGATNYGYLYNWSAATAGESRTSHDETDGNAPYSICPANWRLPIGGIDVITGSPLPANEFNELSARMAGFPNDQDSTYLDAYWTYFQGWQYTGPFKGTLAGYWFGGGFGGQGSYDFLWSGSANSNGADLAFDGYFTATLIAPSNFDGRSVGSAVRCLVN